MSLQDYEHREFFKDHEQYGQTSIKLIFGVLDPRKVGIVNHEDTYSLNAVCVDPQNFTQFKRRFYTVRELMDKTWSYNEITYIKTTEPFLPIGVICEDSISKGEKWIADKLNIPIYLRPKSDEIIEDIGSRQSSLLHKRYGLKPDEKKLF